MGGELWTGKHKVQGLV
uniref:Uncharacterized protein n=1 Tax=Arundo donax TaxID=35708 RepID=A0A0A8XV56_ARUDO